MAESSEESLESTGSEFSLPLLHLFLTATDHQVVKKWLEDKISEKEKELNELKLHSFNNPGIDSLNDEMKEKLRKIHCEMWDEIAQESENDPIEVKKFKLVQYLSSVKQQEEEYANVLRANLDFYRSKEKKLAKFRDDQKKLLDGINEHLRMQPSDSELKSKLKRKQEEYLQKYKNEKKKIIDLMKEHFPDANDTTGMFHLLMDVLHQDDTDGDPYIQLTDRHSPSDVQLLLRSGLVARHPQNPSKIKFYMA